MQLRRPIALIAAATAFAAAAAPASAGEYVVRPVQTISNDSWTVAPTLSSAHDVLSDPLTAPTAPDVSTGYLHGTSTSGSALVRFAAPAIPAGETISGVKLHTYFAGGSSRSVSYDLHSGIWLFGSGYVAAGQPAAWRTAAPWVKPTAAQLSDLRMRVRLGGSGTSTEAKAFAAYAVVTTTGTATGVTDPTTTDTGGETGSSTPTTDGGNGTGDAPANGTITDPELTPAVTLPLSTIAAAANGVLAVPLRCQLVTGCTGWVSIRLVSSTATQSRRRKAAKPKSARKRFRLKAGQSKTVPVRLDRRIKRVVRKKRRAKVAVTIAVDGAAPVTKQVTVLQRRNSGRRR